MKRAGEKVWHLVVHWAGERADWWADAKAGWWAACWGLQWDWRVCWSAGRKADTWDEQKGFCLAVRWVALRDTILLFIAKRSRSNLLVGVAEGLLEGCLVG